MLLFDLCDLIHSDWTISKNVWKNYSVFESKSNNTDIYNYLIWRSPLFGQEFPSLESAELEGKKGGQQQQQQLQQHNFQQPPPSQPQQEGGTGMLPFPRFLTLFDATKFEHFYKIYHEYTPIVIELVI